MSTSSEIERDRDEWKRIATARNVVIGTLGKENERLKAELAAQFGGCDNYKEGIDPGYCENCSWSDSRHKAIWNERAKQAAKPKYSALPEEAPRPAPIHHSV